MTLIIVDDSKEDFELMEIALDEVGYQGKIEWLSDGEQIIKYLDESLTQPEKTLSGHYLILLDINMPKKTGLEALEYIKSNKKLKYLPCIMLTTSQAPSDIKKAYELGANSYLNKPFDFNSMIDLFQSLKSFWVDRNLLPES